MSIVTTRKIGRPKVDSEAVNIRFERKLLADIDAWAQSQPEHVTRPEAIRRLARKGLDA